MSVRLSKAAGTGYVAEVTVDRVYELLERLANLLRAEERSVGQQLGLQPVHLQALAYLARANRYSDSPNAVADWLGLTKGTVSQTLKVLLDRDLVQTNGDATDARRVHLRPTAKGRRALGRLPPAVLREALGDDDAADDLAASLERLLLAIQRSRGGRTFGVCRTCRHFRRDDDGFRCGLTMEPLSAEQTGRLCREHEPGGAGRRG